MALPENLEDTKEYSYRGLTPTWQVFLGHDDGANIKALDISMHLEEITEIDKSIDYPNLLDYRVGECTLIINDRDDEGRRFDPQNENNVLQTLFLEEIDEDTDNHVSANPNGFRVPVRVYAGFRDDTYGNHIDLIFKGEILSLTRNVKTQTVTLVAVDTPQGLRDEVITNFGLLKSIRLGGVDGAQHGEYPLPLDLSPPSLATNDPEDDAAGTPTAVYYDELDTEGFANKVDMNRVQQLKTEGILDNKNFIVTPEQLQTEGGSLEDVGSLPNTPFVVLRAPYRHKNIEFIVKKILEHVDVDFEDVDFELPSMLHGDKYVSSNGRVGYDTQALTANEEFDERTDPLHYWRWSGFVNDFYYDESAEKIYFLYSTRGSVIDRRKRILEYDRSTDTYTPLTITADIPQGEDRQYWSIVKDPDTDTLYVLGSNRATEDREFGEYDSSETPSFVSESAVTIWKYTRSGNNLIEEVFADGDDPYSPQLAVYIHYGFTQPSRGRTRTRYGLLPYSKRLHIYDGDLYYLWAKTTLSAASSTSHFGVAKKPLDSGDAEAVLTAGKDRLDTDTLGYNSAGCSFYIDDKTPEVILYAAFTWIIPHATSSQSKLRIVKLDLSS